MNGLAFLDMPDAELTRAWAALPQGPSDGASGNDCPACCRCGCGECWQYMGTVELATPEGPAWVHQFRHRHHPATGRRVYVNVPAAIGWAPQVQP